MIISITVVVISILILTAVYLYDSVIDTHEIIEIELGVDEKRKPSRMMKAKRWRRIKEGIKDPDLREYFFCGKDPNGNPLYFLGSSKVDEFLNKREKEGGTLGDVIFYPGSKDCVPLYRPIKVLFKDGRVKLVDGRVLKRSEIFAIITYKLEW